MNANEQRMAEVYATECAYCGRHAPYRHSIGACKCAGCGSLTSSTGRGIVDRRN